MDYSGLIVRQPYVQNGPKYKIWHFFMKLTPFQFGFYALNFWIFSIWPSSGRLADPQIAPFLTNWQTPFFSKRPAIWGSKYLWWLYFSLNQPPFNLDLVYKLFQKVSNWTILGQLAEPHLAIMASNLEPQMMSMQFFHKSDSFRFGFKVVTDFL